MDSEKITGFRECEIASCIDHTTTDLFDLSAEELRFLCRYYRPQYDAVFVLLPPLIRPKVFVPTTATPNSLPPKPKVKLLTPSQSPHLILDNVYGPDDHPDHDDHDDIDVDDDDYDDDGIVPIDIDEDDGDDHDDAKNCSVIASSVGSNDYVSDDDMEIEDDAVSSGRNYVSSISV